MKGINAPKTTALLSIIWVFMPFLICSQKDTTTFEGITVKGNHKTIETFTTLYQQEIEQLAPEDMGAVLQYITGITVKNYGGIGGMKTISHRGMGGEHTQLTMDGIPINDPQSGLINFGTISSNNIESAQLTSSAALLPASAQIKSSSIAFTSFEQTFSTTPYALKTTLKMGSFGEKEGFLSFKKGGKNGFFAASGNYRSYKGNYPYQLEFGNSTEKHTRKNNGLEEYHIQLGGGWKWKRKNVHHLLKGYAKTTQINQELPGAVIFYNDLAKTHQKTSNSNVGISHQALSSQFNIKTFASYHHRFLRYQDPHYLNAAGGLKNEYETHSLAFGGTGKYQWKDIGFIGGYDASYDHMKSNRELGTPTRFSHTAMAKVKYHTSYFYAEAGLFLQQIMDGNQQESHRNNYSKFHPQLGIYSSDKLLKNIQLFAWFKPSSRAPSFNDLYYSQVGNVDLIPEETAQINVGANYGQTLNRYELFIQGNIFHNQVDHKILALPTKNLFIWSIQNVGKVSIWGGDINIKNTLHLRKDWKLQLQLGGSYQYAVDVSKPDSPTYRHQIAYTPAFTGNARGSIMYRDIGLHLSGIYIGERYSLNENIPSNRLNPYATLDITGSYTYKLKKKHTFKVQAGVKNVTNESYDFIRYFVMPGRNYYIQLSYEFN